MTDAPLWTLAPFLGLVFLASLTGALFRPGAWYKSLKKPSWTPPDFVFPVAWGFLYVAMAYAAWRVWAIAGLHPALAVWGVQLALNALWSAVFFGLKRPGWALAEVGLLWLAVAVTIYVFAQIDALAALMLAPYLAWVSLAAFLNREIVRLQGSAAA